MSLICKISSILIFKVWAYNFLLLIVLVNLLLFNLNKLEKDIEVLEAAIGALEAVVGFITNQTNIYLWKDLLFLSMISLSHSNL